MATRSISAVLLVLALSVCGCVPQAAPATSASDSPQVAGLPLTAFVPNPGLGDAAVLFRTLSSAATLLFERHAVLLPAPCADEALLGSNTDAAPPDLRLEFIEASDQTQVVGGDELAGVVNFQVGSDSAAWFAGVPTYGSIAYRELYAGIDLLYQGQEGALKGTYVVSPGADPASIRWRYAGAARVAVRKGALRVYADATDSPALTEEQPVAWQTVNGQRRAVRVRYRVARDGSVGLSVGRYDVHEPLVIDPTLVYASYLGGVACEAPWDIATDATGKVYLTGQTNTRNFQTTPQNCSTPEKTDVFVTKLDPALAGANQHIYTTYIGGNDYDASMCIAVDAQGRAYVSGYSWSSNFPTTANAFQRTHGGGMSDGFVARLNAAGAASYVSLLGGEEFEEQFQLAVGNGGLTYVTGFTDSSDFPTTTNAYSRALNNRDAYVAVLDPSQSGAASLIYSTLYGGSGYDEGYGVEVLNGVVYLAGTTTSTNLPVRYAPQAAYGGGGGYGDAFVAVFDPTQTGAAQLQFGTYLGGNQEEVCGWLAVDQSASLTLVGVTKSANFPKTVGPSHGGDYDAFVAQWSTTAHTLTYARYVGGSGRDGLRAVQVDRQGNVYAVGGTGSANLALVAPVQATYRGGTSPDVYTWLGPGDGLIVKLDRAGAVTFCSYLGGPQADGALGVALGPSGKVWVALGTRSSGMTTVEAYQSANAGAWDGYVAAIGGLMTSPVVIPLVRR